MSVSEERRIYSNKVGSDTENMFVQACEAFGYKCEKTDTQTDIYLHIDYYINRTDGSATSVDVKGGNYLNTIWVEFKNVCGSDGWVYGDAEFIAFDMPELFGFVMVKRKELVEHCEKIVEKVFVPKYQATRKLYQRAGRKDVISRLEITDLQEINSYKIIKYAVSQNA